MGVTWMATAGAVPLLLSPAAESEPTGGEGAGIFAQAPSIVWLWQWGFMLGDCLSLALCCS